ncbi:MAG: hypothetical protein H6727_11105 [Myxococcales bacterium]|nr:hypothetical protein [Myxococcales bacterium]
MKRFLLFGMVCGCLLSGCTVHFPAKVVSGRIDVMKPPKYIEQPQIVEPEDPGRDSLIVSPGLMWAGGWFWPDDRQLPQKDVARFSIELSLQWSPAKVWEAIFFLPAFPTWTLGINLGMDLYDSSMTHNVGAVYVEGQFLLFGLGALAVGYAWNFAEEKHGPQLSLLLLSLLYVRATYLFEHGWGLQLGVCWKLPIIWTWAR